MKQFMKYAGLVAVMLLAAMAAQARVINISADNIKGDFATQLNAACGRATYGDTVVLNFGRGTYTVDATVTLRCHVIMRGQGRDKSVILLDNNASKLKTDTYFLLHGNLQNPIHVSISDLGFKLREHKGFWWDGIEKYVVQIHHANSVDISNVDSFLADANATNFNLHVCSNVNITGCTLTNYNNGETGGCLWIRGEMHNVRVHGNTFYKYGKDEILAVFDRVVDNSTKYIRGKASRTDIYIEGNEFHYGNYKGWNKMNPEANCDMLFSLFTDHRKTSDCCLTRNFHLRGNKFYINDVTTRCMYIGFDPADEHSDIYIEGNEIINGALSRDYKFYHKDIEVHDLSNCGDTIRLNGNRVINRALVLNSGGSTGYMFLQTRGGVVKMENNSIVNEVKRAMKDGNPYGLQLVWCQEEGGDVTMTGNVCKGLNYLAYVGGGEGTPLFTVKATNNYFEGNTRIYSHKIKEMNLEFTGNTFMSNSPSFFLQEFAPRGTVVFNYNDVTVTTGGGQLMTHWGSNDTRSMRFERLEMKGNKFKGVKNESDLLRNVTNVRKRKVSSNAISR